MVVFEVQIPLMDRILLKMIFKKCASNQQSDRL